ncbi:hypothetical protein TanjilG_29423 [Lupinus angustifolius]|uniref:B box-type domain-containing protein n=1 Tax=Lupinus angustifolius TaxID=3871 RepID=A0A4P1R564_LUPAN|nr:hypothetical protein TanjilG_29423 [Lupinus angustifolius]
MSASSSTNENKAEQVDNCKAQEKRWLDVFLGETFFGSCATHPFRRNELNKYCINCDVSACEYCISSGSHRHHNILKVYRHIHKVVVSLRAMEKHIDCSEIQVKSVLRNPDDSGLARPYLESRVKIRKGATFEPRKPMEEMQKENGNPVSFRKRKRKGTPHRAPFF